MSFLIFLGLLVLACVAGSAFMIAEKRAAHRKEDRLLLSELRETGSDLSKPHDVEFFFFAPSSSAAEALKADLESDGFEADSVEDETPPQVVVIARTQLVPDEIALSTMRQAHIKRASKYDARYDGWEASVVAPAED